MLLARTARYRHGRPTPGAAGKAVARQGVGGADDLLALTALTARAPAGNREAPVPSGIVQNGGVSGHPGIRASIRHLPLDFLTACRGPAKCADGRPGPCLNGMQSTRAAFQRPLRVDSASPIGS